MAVSSATVVDIKQRLASVLPQHLVVGVDGTDSSLRALDVAATVAFLLSDDAAYINGHAVMIDGGQTIHGHPRWVRTDYRQAGQDVWEPVR